MRTDELIDLLSTNVEPVNPQRMSRGLSGAVVAGAVVSLAAMLLALGVRPDLHEAGALAHLFAKLAFTIAIVVVAYAYLTRLARPGGENRTRLALVALPFAAIVLLATLSLALAPRSHWDDMIIGKWWLECLISIPIIAVLPFLLIVWAVRRLAAPTDLVGTGALVGLVAGGVSALGYALHCTDDTLPFIALWYGGTIALCTLAGAVLGPRLLRW